MGSVLEVRVLGPVEVLVDTRPLELRPRALQVLAALASSPGRVVPVERLIDLVWGDEPPASARTQVSIQISALRREFERAGGSRDAVETTTVGYRLRVDDDLVRLDLTDVERILGSLDASDSHETAAAQLRSALELWRGPVLGGQASTDLAATVRHWEELRLSTHERLYAHELALGRDHELVGELTELVFEQPLRERLRAQLMTALWRSGRQADALAVYREGRRILVDELGIEPGAELRALEQAILTSDPETSGPSLPPGTPAGNPSDAPTDAPGGTASEPDGSADPDEPRTIAELPAAVSTFTGRDAEVVRLCRQLTGDLPDPRPVAAIAGIGGVGKSTLALQVAHQVAEHFDDGLLYLDLHGSTPGTEPLSVREALARMLRSLGANEESIPEGADEAAGRFRSMTRDRRVLIVLDNARDSAQVRPLLPAGPACRVLVTSRRVLADLPGATHEHLDTLPEPDAVRLLARLIAPRPSTTRPSTTRPSAPTSAESTAMSDIVRLCGLLPLAIALAAARIVARRTGHDPDVGSDHLVRLADRLRRQTGRLDLLRTPDRGVRAAFAVGYESLEPDQRRMFRSVGLLDGSDVGIPVAAALAGVPEETAEDLLEELVDAQLLLSPRPGRYALHDLLRLFARECAAEEDTEAERTAAIRRALHCHLGTARVAAVFRRPMAAWRTELPPATDTLAHPGLELRDESEITTWFALERHNLPAVVRQAWSLPDEEGPMLAAALCTALVMPLFRQGRVPELWPFGQLALEAAQRTGDPLHAAVGHDILGYCHMQIGDLERAWTHNERARDAFHEAGNTELETARIHTLAVIADRAGRHEESIPLYEQAIARDRAAGLDAGIPPYLTGLGLAYRHLGRYDDEVRAHTEALELAEIHTPDWIPIAVLANLAEALRLAGHPAEAAERFRQALDYYDESAPAYANAELEWGLGRAHHDLGDDERARECWRESARILSELGLVDDDERHAIDTADLPETPEVIRRNT